MASKSGLGKTVYKAAVDQERGFFPFVWRHRIGLAPIIYAIVLYLAELNLRYIVKLEFQMYCISMAIVALVAFLFIRFTTSDREAKWHARRNQNYLYIVGVASIGWGTWFQYQPYTLELFKLASTVFLWGSLLLAIPYWFDLRRRTRVTLDNKIDSWPLLTEATRLKNTKLSGFRKSSHGWKARLRVPNGLSKRMVMSSAELIEQLMDAPPGSVNIDPVTNDSNAFDVTCIETDPHEEPIEWDEEGVRSIMEDALIGKYADHQEETTAWWTKGIGGFHRLMAGVTRSGKSGLMKLLIAIYAEASDTVFWFADLKDGTALLPFSPLADWTVTTPEDALIMCRALKETVNARSRELAAQGKEVWTPSRKKPVLIIFIDEIAELLGDGVPTKIKLQAQASLVSVARKGAGVGVLMVMATQYPTLSALGTSQLKSQLTWRACFRMAQPDQAYYILPGVKSTGIDPYNIDKHRKGTCYIDAEGEFRMAKLRILYFADSMIKGLVERFFGQRPEMDVESLKWRDKDLKAVYEARRKWTPEMLEDLKNGKLAGYDEDDLYDDEGDEILFEDDDVAVDLGHGHERTEEDEMADELRDETERPLAMASPVTAIVAGIRPGSREWFESTQMGRAVAARWSGPTATADRKSREAWLADRAQPELPEAQRLFVAALDKAQVERRAMTVAELSEACGRSQRQTYRWVEKLRDVGQLIRVEEGRYTRP